LRNTPRGGNKIAIKISQKVAATPPLPMFAAEFVAKQTTNSSKQESFHNLKETQRKLSQLESELSLALSYAPKLEGNNEPLRHELALKLRSLLTSSREKLATAPNNQQNHDKTLRSTNMKTAN
jgi:hypothetical protein